MMRKDIHDIRPPVMTGMDPALAEALVWGAGAVVICALILLIVRYWWKRRGISAPSSPPALALPAPYEMARRELAQCRVHGSHDAKMFYFELSRIVRTYVSGTFQINCSGMTSPEMARAVKGIDTLDVGVKRALIRFQDRCDPIRYMPLDARIPLDNGQMAQDLAEAERLVAQIEQMVRGAAFSEANDAPVVRETQKAREDQATKEDRAENAGEDDAPNKNDSETGGAGD